MHEGDDLDLSVEKFENWCSGKSLARAFKLHRAPLRAVDDIQATLAENLPLDPYFIGFWLGDGTARRPQVSTSDLELKVYLDNYVERLNEARLLGTRPFSV